MSWLSDLFSGSAKGIIDGVGQAVDRFVHTADEKAEIKIELERIVTSQILAANEQANREMEARERVLVAELNQGDQYTKRARPTVVYAGLVMIAFNYCVVTALQQFLGLPLQPFELPTEFWLGWSGIVSTWSIGRSLERRGTQNKATQIITGTKSLLR